MEMCGFFIWFQWINFYTVSRIYMLFKGGIKYIYRFLNEIDNKNNSNISSWLERDFDIKINLIKLIEIIVKYRIYINE